MTTVLSNPEIADEERRTRLYKGHLLVYSASPESLALVEHARDLIAEAFGAKDPQTAQHIKTDTRDQPKPEEPVQLHPQVRVVPEAGGVIVFSGNQLHSTVPNTSGRTRFSVDFRTVNIDDVQSRREAPNFDAECTGTSLRDFLRARDFERIAEDVALAYERVTPADP